MQFYSPDDIAGVIAYATDRGVRVVPEVDVPAHSACFAPLVPTHGVRFCDSTNQQLYNDFATKCGAGCAAAGGGG